MNNYVVSTTRATTILAAKYTRGSKNKNKNKLYALNYEIPVLLLKIACFPTPRNSTSPSCRRYPAFR